MRHTFFYEWVNLGVLCKFFLANILNISLHGADRDIGPKANMIRNIFLFFWESLFFWCTGDLRSNDIVFTLRLGIAITTFTTV